MRVELLVACQHYENAQSPVQFFHWFLFLPTLINALHHLVCMELGNHFSTELNDQDFLDENHQHPLMGELNLVSASSSMCCGRGDWRLDSVNVSIAIQFGDYVLSSASKCSLRQLYVTTFNSKSFTCSYFCSNIDMTGGIIANNYHC